MSELLKKYAVLFFLLVSTSTILAQKTTVIGTVSDAETGEPLMFVNLLLQNTDAGTTTDEAGKFILESNQPSDSLIVSFIGYRRTSLSIEPNKIQKLDIKLQPKDEQLDEVLIEAGIDPAMFVWEKTVKRKPFNNPEKVDYLEYDVYNKFQFDLNNIGEKFKKSKLFKKFDFVMDNIDTVGGKPFLPILLSESKSTYYWRENRKNTKR